VPSSWTVVVPVKGTADAKSRLGASAELALAIALDTVAAVSDAAGVGSVIVVTVDAVRAEFETIGARVVVDPGDGLVAAIAEGISAAGDERVAVLLGDLPALRPTELAAALVSADQHPLTFIADADGDGTSLITALDASDHRPAFGLGSSAAHLDAGYIEIGMSPDSGLRRDVDTREQLDALAANARLGPRTTLLARIP
jgi:2-phospho-L-lactate guanylyltransferase